MTTPRFDPARERDESVAIAGALLRAFLAGIAVLAVLIGAVWLVLR